MNITEHDEMKTLRPSEVTPFHAKQDLKTSPAVLLRDRQVRVAAVVHHAVLLETQAHARSIVRPLQSARPVLLEVVRNAAPATYTYSGLELTSPAPRAAFRVGLAWVTGVRVHRTATAPSGVRVRVLPRPIRVRVVVTTARAHCPWSRSLTGSGRSPSREGQGPARRRRAFTRSAKTASRCSNCTRRCCCPCSVRRTRLVWLG